MEGFRQLGGVHQRRDCDSWTRLTGKRSAYLWGSPGVYGHALQSPEGDEPPSRGCPFGLLDLIARFRATPFAKTGEPPPIEAVEMRGRSDFDEG